MLEKHDHGAESGEFADAETDGGSQAENAPLYALRYQRPSPTDHPRFIPEIAPIGGVIRVEPEDFQVEEIPLYSFCGSGEHCFVTIEKRNRTTLEAREYVARSLGVRSRDIGFAGFKDKRAVARQTLSIAGVRLEDVRAIDAPWLKVVDITFHRNKLRTGHLSGNRFRILIRGVEAPDALARCRAIVARLRETGLPNLYGPQRFGRFHDGYRLGRALLHRDTQQVVEYLLGPRPEAEQEQYRAHFAAQRYEEALKFLPPGRPAEAAMLHTLRRYPANLTAAVRKIPQELKRMYYSSYQAFLFNWCLRERLEWGGLAALSTPRAGDLAVILARGSIFLVEDVEEARVRAAAGEIAPSGPIFGRKMRLALGEEGGVERAILEVENLRPQSWISHVRGLHLDGTRRAFSIPLGEVDCREGHLANSIVLTFTLPPGAFATTLLEEVMGQDRTQPPRGSTWNESEGAESAEEAEGDAEDGGEAAVE